MTEPPVSEDSQLPPSVTQAVDHDTLREQPLRDPFPKGGLAEVFRRRYLLQLLVRKEVRQRYQGSALGFIWSYIQPAVRFALYFFALGLILGLHQDVPNFAIHLFCAMVAVNYFNEMFGQGTRAILKNKALVQKMAMPREMFPVASVLVSAIHAFPQLVILLIAGFVNGTDLTWQAAWDFTLAAMVLTTFGTGLAILFSALNVYFRDFEQIVQMIVLISHWAVPQLYPWQKVGEASIPSWVKELYLANPLAEAVILMQRAIWFSTCDRPDADICTATSAFPDHLTERGLIMVAAGLVFLVLAQRVFSRLESKFPERLN